MASSVDVIKNKSSTVLGFFDTSVDPVLVGAMGGESVSAPDLNGEQVIDVLTKAGVLDSRVVDPAVNTVAPVITGEAKVGETITCSEGTWTGEVDSFVYDWWWTYSGSIDWKPMGGDITNSYLIDNAFQNCYLKCTVIARNSAGDVEIDSERVGPVASAG